MRLTNTLRDAFVRAAMQDVPKQDYKEEIRKQVQADAYSKLPAKVKALHDNKDLRHYIATQNIWIGGEYVNVPCGDRYVASGEISEVIQVLQNKSDAQQEARQALQRKLRGCAYACSTRKSLLEMLPEFEKYLPEDDAAACKTLPVVANVVSDFIKAGWPASAKVTKKPVAKAAR